MLTTDQQYALEDLKELLIEKHPWFCIEGPAGTGKSTVIKQFIEDTNLYYAALRKVMPTAEAREIILTATTNKATNALQQATQYPTQTIHSLLGGRLFKGKMYYNGPKVSLDGVILVVDEYSYVDVPLLIAIEKFRTPTTSVVFIGDPCQLTPVGSDVLMVKEKGFPTATLTEIVRQETATLLDVSTQCRSYVETGALPELTPDGESLIYYGEDEEAFINALVTSNKQGHKPKFISYSNARVQTVNQFLKEKLTSSPSFVAGDVGIVNKHYEGRGRGDSVKVDTSLTIIKALPRTVTLHTSTGTFNIPAVQVTIEGGKHYLVADRYEDYVDISQTPLKSFEDNRSVEFAQAFMDLRPEYACTVHKSQGSTYDEVFIDLSDFSSIRDEETLARLLYVAMTRTRKKLHFIGSL